MAKQQTSGCTWLIAIFFVGGIVSLFVCCGGFRTRDGGGGATKARPRIVSTGEIGVLRLAGDRDVILAVDVSLYDRMMQFVTAGDDRGLAQLALVSRVFLVPSGTKAKVIGRPKLGVAEVRIEDGDMTGRSGFVPREFITDV